MLTVPIHSTCTGSVWLFGIYPPVISTEQNLNRIQCTIRSIMFCSSGTAFPSQHSAACRSGFRERSWNEQEHFLKYCDKFQISRETSQEFLSDNWQHCATNCLFFLFGQLVFKVILSCIVSVFASYICRAASPWLQKGSPPSTCAGL
jgi:hypothetical protein